MSVFLTVMLLASSVVPQEDAKGISLTPPDAAERWTFSVMPLAARDGQAASHALLFVGALRDCTTPGSFSIEFAIDGGRTISKPAALLSRQPSGDGCVDGLATVFPEGSADPLARATRIAVTVPNATFELTAPQLAYLRRGLARRAPAAAANEAARLNEQAVALVDAGRLTDAREAAEGAVAAAERLYGPDHAEVGGVLLNLGMIERKLGDTDAALAHYRRAIRLLEPAGPSQALGIVLDNLGRVLLERKDLVGAIAATSRAVDVLSEVVGPTHENVGYALNNLAMLWDASGNKAKASATCDRAVAILVKALGPDDPRLAPFLEDQETLRWKAGRK